MQHQFQLWYGVTIFTIRSTQSPLYIGILWRAMVRYTYLTMTSNYVVLNESFLH